MKILNFSHAISDEQFAQLHENFGLDIAPEDVIGVKTDLDLAQSLGPQAVALVNEIGWARAEWETTATLVILPSHPDIAVLVAAEIEGRRGHLPDILRRKPVRDEKSGVMRFEVVEIINPYAHRLAARRQD